MKIKLPSSPMNIVIRCFIEIFLLSRDINFDVNLILWMGYHMNVSIDIFGYSKYINKSFWIMFQDDKIINYFNHLCIFM